MKTCPVCRSLCFDDMPVCYGCMHNFDRDGSCMGGHSDSAASSGRLAGGVAPGKDAAAPRDGKKDGIAMEEEKPSASEGERRATLRIPMVTSVAPGSFLSGSASGLSSGTHSGSVEPPASAPFLAIEAPEGYRMVLRLERA